MLDFLPALLEKTPFNIVSRIFSYDVCKDFILPIIIAGVAAYMVYWAFVKETKRDKKKELEAEKQRQQDKLYYFSNCVKSIHAISRDQNEANLLFAEAQAKNPREIQQISFLSLNELRRMTSDLPLEEYMLAYANHFGANRKETIREFNQIIIRIDMLNDAFRNTKQHYKMTQKLEQASKLKFMAHFHSAHTQVAMLSNNFRRSSPTLVHEINQIAKAFQSEGLNRNIEFCYHRFFIPFNHFAVNYLMVGLTETPQLQQLAIETKDGMATYEQLVRENRGLAHDFKKKYESLKPAIEDLEKYAKRLLEDFGG